jgi:hypothetical protein
VAAWRGARIANNSSRVDRFLSPIGDSQGSLTKATGLRYLVVLWNKNRKTLSLCFGFEYKHFDIF